MTKTGRIITATLLTIATIGLVVFAVKKGTKPKTLQTKAEDTQLTDLTDTTWLFNETIVKENYWHIFNINFTSNNTYYTGLIFQNDQDNEHIQLIAYRTPYTKVYQTNWLNTAYRTIQIQNGADITNTELINILYTYATLQYNPYEEGYQAGYNDSEAFNRPIALQPLMLNILTMPFTFISQAFDVTLWPGTQYAFNIANFIKGLIAIATILFIIKMFTSGFSIIGNYTGQATRNQVNRSQVKLNKAKTEKIKKETNK